ncbi:tyrosine-protein phosphatase [Staphylococcus simulans]|uniref:tyrosine-protein phosphatase n=1 Tax=Staphylococcus simulans TaxID=1286 RepID=UPI000D1D3822|nr:CpsB/CapC family capsule biosynthesis tyrosine phosphatase [Staphylococcus simulans]PTJ21586.1 capsular biosynthesis protein [Staphylococcus simulans]
MIDIHNHIIPSVDDGPSNEEAMIKLVKQAADQNITGIVASPHHLHYRYDNEFQDIVQKVQEINEHEEVKKLGITVYPGQEVRISDQLLTHLDNGKIKGINNSKYLLLELPSNQVPNYTQNIIYEIQTRGFIPIIVHPERNKQISQDINILYGLVGIGALSQLTASSLTGTFGKNIQKLSLQMIEHNLVHFVASDAHSADERPFGFNNLLSNKKLSNYQDDISRYLNNNKLMIEDSKIISGRPVEYTRKKILGIF